MLHMPSEPGILITTCCCMPAGARVLSECLDLVDLHQRYKLSCQLQALVDGGFKLRPGEWPQQLLEQRQRCAGSGGYKSLQIQQYRTLAEYGEIF